MSNLLNHHDHSYSRPTPFAALTVHTVLPEISSPGQPEAQTMVYNLLIVNYSAENKQAVPTFRIAATSLDSCIICPEHPPAGNRHIGLIRKVEYLMGTRSRDIEISYTVTSIEPCLPVKEGEINIQISNFPLL